MAHVGLAGARLGICIWGRETDAGGEEIVPGSRGDKQLAASVCTYPTLAGICLWTLGMFTLESDRCDSVVRTHSSVRGEKGAHCDKYQTCNRTVLVAESLQPNPSEALCTSFCRQEWRATASSSWKYHRNCWMGKDILDVLGSFFNPKPICCQQKTSLSMLYIFQVVLNSLDPVGAGKTGHVVLCENPGFCQDLPHCPISCTSCPQ